MGLDPDKTPKVPQKDLEVTPKIGQKKPKLKKVVDQIKPPELTHIPKLLPIFVELVRNFFFLSRFCVFAHTFLGDCSFRVTSPGSSNGVDLAVMSGIVAA